MTELFLYNSLSRKKDPFTPLKEGHVGVYSCGPTVYNFVHIGNLRAYIFDDILVRTLRYNFGENNVKWVMNITDVDDKTIRDSKAKYPNTEPKEALLKFTKEYSNFFLKDLEELNVNFLSNDVNPRATEDKYLLAMKELVKKIYAFGLAYIKDGSVYFNVVEYSKKHKYGQLVNLDISKLQAGLRIDTDEYDKNDLQDFVLWKGKKEGEPFWDFNLAEFSLPGRPGWHIECSAMSNSILGCPFDIHTGGGDLKFPHHEDEIAQSVAGYGIEKPVNCWMHNGMLMVDGKKMSKSLNNFYRLKEVKEKSNNTLAFRYLCLLTHYRKPLNFTLEALSAADRALTSIYVSVEKLLNEVRKNHDIGADNFINTHAFYEYKNDFKKALFDDLNTPQAIAVLQKVLKSKLEAVQKLATIIVFDKVLGLNLCGKQYSMKADSGNYNLAGKNIDMHVNVNEEEVSKEIEELKILRQKARDEKNWPESDRLRAEIEKLGYSVEDTTNEMRVNKK